MRAPAQVPKSLRGPALRVRILIVGLIVAASAVPCHAVQLKVSREAFERTLKQQLFSGPDGRYYVKGNAQSPCFTYAENPKVTFVNGRIVVRTTTKARIGKAVGNACVGVTLSFAAEVSQAPQASDETIGFGDARVETIADHKELNFILAPFLLRTIPSNMKVNAADLLRKALANSSAASGYTIALERFKIQSFQIVGDSLVVDADGDFSVK